MTPRTRRPLIEEYRRSYGLPATVHRLAEEVTDLQLATREGDVTQNIYVSGGGGSGGGGGPTLTDGAGVDVTAGNTINWLPAMSWALGG